MSGMVEIKSVFMLHKDGGKFYEAALITPANPLNNPRSLNSIVVLRWGKASEKTIRGGGATKIEAPDSRYRTAPIWENKIAEKAAGGYERTPHHWGLNERSGLHTVAEADVESVVRRHYSNPDICDRIISAIDIESSSSLWPDREFVVESTKKVATESVILTPKTADWGSW